MNIVQHQKIEVAGSGEVEFGVGVFARVGGYLYDLTGQTSPWARVEFYTTQGNLRLMTIADEKGIFVFRSVVAPPKTGDFCFVAYDLDHRANMPLCFPQPAPRVYNRIEGIILPPSLSIQLVGKQLLVEGRTVPEVGVDLYLFDEGIASKVIGEVLAFVPKRLIVHSDKNGFFTAHLPLLPWRTTRLFAALHLNQPGSAPKSNILEISYIPWWWLLWGVVVAGLLVGFWLWRRQKSKDKSNLT